MVQVVRINVVYLTITSYFSLSLSLLCIRARVYDVRNAPSSYRQPCGRRQSLSRRYCEHSVWFFSCASRTAPEFQGALAVSCKYFKQSKWPWPHFHTPLRHIDHTYVQQDIRVCEDDHLKPPKRQFSNSKAL